ncbi:MAG TPA: hypothetical protein VEI02_08270 [Planctomycetota bacterium]|nr:hypothetical protein [Planctomycetota bacterium]
MSDLDRIDPNASPEARRRRTLARRVTLGFFVLLMAGGGLGFCVKIHNFLQDWLDGNGINFGGSHLVSYGLTAAGYALLLGFAFLKGHFADIERPKYDLIAREESLDRADFR